jgi:hypothetical protein
MVVVCAMVAVAPTFLGSRWIYDPLLKRFEAGDFRFSAESVQLGWFSSTVLRGIDLSESSGEHLLHIDEVRNDRGLLSSLLHGRDLGVFQVIKPEVDIELLTETSNLERLIATLKKTAEAQPRKASAPPEINFDIQLIDASVRVAKPKESGEVDVLVVVPPFSVNIFYRGLDDHAQLQIAKTTILDQVALTPELLRLGIDRAIPLLAKSAWFKGNISLEIGDVRVPLETPLDSEGSAVLTMHNVTSGPSDPAVIAVLDVVAKLSGRNEPHELVFMENSRVAVKMSERRVSHEGLKFGLPRVDPRLQFASAGTVGIEDKSLDLNLTVPVPLALMARREEVRALGVPTMNVPVRGKLGEAVVDWAEMRGDGADILGMIRGKVAGDSPALAGALKTLEGITGGQTDQAIATGVELFKMLREARQATSKEKSSEEKDILPDGKESPSEDPKVDRPIFDALRGILQGKK